MKTVGQALREAVGRLDLGRVDAPRTTARVLLAQALGKSKEWLVAHDTDAMPEAAGAAFEELLRRVVAHEPLAYVLGHREFYGLDLAVDSRVLIPRPETEMLVELTLGYLTPALPDAPPPGVHYIDIGTGSGAVPIAVAKHAPGARIIASDVSTDALAVARLNAARHGVGGQITFVHSDLLAGIDPTITCVVLTANLPYVTQEEIDGLPPEIQDHEPRVALDGGLDGLDLVRLLLGQIAERVRGGAPLRAAFFEFGASQGAAVLAAARELAPMARSEIKRDLGKRDRVLCLYFDPAG